MSTLGTIEVHSLGYGLPRVRVAQLHFRVLLKVAICVVPSMTLVGFGALYAGSRWLFGWVLLFMAYHFIARKQIEAIVLIVALVPAMMLMRGAFYYSAPIVISLCAVLVQLTLSPDALSSFRRNKLLVGFLLFSATYWWVSFVRSGDYSSNMRVLEFSLTATNVYLLANQRSYFATAMVGLSLSAFSVAVGLLPYGDRLGIGQVEDISVGNPIAIGLSATLIFLLTIVDRGQWLFVEKHPVWRALLAMLAGICLALSTSRGSWLVTLVGLIIILIFNRHSRKLLLGTVLLVTIVLAALLQTDRGPSIRHYYDNAGSSDKSLEKRTTGRANQWESFPRVLGDSPIWGFGPGSGKAVSLRYTKEGKPWHALYLFVGTETGLMGLLCLAFFLGTLIRRGLAHWRFCGEAGPLLALLCFMIIGVSVSGIDAISGVFLGFAFFGSDPLMRLRHVSASEGLLYTLSEAESTVFT